MPVAAPISTTRFRTLAEVQARLGDVPADRVLTTPAPGTATPEDLLDPTLTGDRTYELIDGILAEKAMGAQADSIGGWLLAQILYFAEAGGLGKVFGGQGGYRFGARLVRYPDVSFVRWDSVTDPEALDALQTPFVPVPPDLAVEVLSPSNTPREMALKLRDYAAAGVKLVWYVDPARRTVTVYPRGRERGSKVLTEADALDGGKVLPGFTLSVRAIFASRLPKKPNR